MYYTIYTHLQCLYNAFTTKYIKYCNPCSHDIRGSTQLKMVTWTSWSAWCRRRLTWTKLRRMERRRWSSQLKASSWRPWVFWPKAELIWSLALLKALLGSSCWHQDWWKVHQHSCRWRAHLTPWSKLAREGTWPQAIAKYTYTNITPILHLCLRFSLQVLSGLSRRRTSSIVCVTRLDMFRHGTHMFRHRNYEHPEIAHNVMQCPCKPKSRAQLRNKVGHHGASALFIAALSAQTQMVRI